MNRRDFLIRSSMAAAAGMIPSPLQRMFQDSSFYPLRNDTGYFVNRGGTIGWLSNNDALVAVDSQYPQTVQSFIEGIKSRNSRKMDYLINTHHHGDHTGGNQAFEGYTEHILAHQRVPVLQRAAAERRGEETLQRQAYADETYSDRWEKDFGTETVHCMHFGRAHTGGDTVIYFENANVAHVGDLVFNRVYPFIDRGGLAHIENWIDVLKDTTKELQNDTIYIFGHGNPDFGVTGDKEDLIRKSDYLEALLEYTQKGISEGRSLEEIQSAEVIPGFEDFNLEGWSLSLASNIEAAYLELTEGPIPS